MYIFLCVNKKLKFFIPCHHVFQLQQSHYSTNASTQFGPEYKRAQASHYWHVAASSSHQTRPTPYAYRPSGPGASGVAMDAGSTPQAGAAAPPGTAADRSSATA